MVSTIWCHFWGNSGLEMKWMIHSIWLAMPLTNKIRKWDLNSKSLTNQNARMSRLAGPLSGEVILWCPIGQKSSTPSQSDQPCISGRITRGTEQLDACHRYFNDNTHTYIYIYIYICVFFCTAFSAIDKKWPLWYNSRIEKSDLNTMRNKQGSEQLTKLRGLEFLVRMR